MIVFYEPLKQKNLLSDGGPSAGIEGVRHHCLAQIYIFKCKNMFYVNFHVHGNCPYTHTHRVDSKATPSMI